MSKAQLVEVEGWLYERHLQQLYRLCKKGFTFKFRNGLIDDKENGVWEYEATYEGTHHFYSSNPDYYHIEKFIAYLQRWHKNKEEK